MYLFKFYYNLLWIYNIFLNETKVSCPTYKYCTSLVSFPQNFPIVIVNINVIFLKFLTLGKSGQGLLEIANQFGDLLGDGRAVHKKQETRP